MLCFRLVGLKVSGSRLLRAPTLLGRLTSRLGLLNLHNSRWYSLYGTNRPLVLLMYEKVIRCLLLDTCSVFISAYLVYSARLHDVPLMPYLETTWLLLISVVVLIGNDEHGMQSFESVVAVVLCRVP